MRISMVSEPIKQFGNARYTALFCKCMSSIDENFDRWRWGVRNVEATKSSRMDLNGTCSENILRKNLLVSSSCVFSGFYYGKRVWVIVLMWLLCSCQKTRPNCEWCSDYPYENLTRAFLHAPLFMWSFPRLKNSPHKCIGNLLSSEYPCIWKKCTSFQMWQDYNGPFLISRRMYQEKNGNEPAPSEE